MLIKNYKKGTCLNNTCKRISKDSKCNFVFPKKLSKIRDDVMDPLSIFPFPPLTLVILIMFSTKKS